jgi:hypothetical protein
MKKDKIAEEKAVELPGYPKYPASEDIYNKFHKESEIDPESPSEFKKEMDLETDEWNEKSFEEDVSGDDLDVPGSELDDDAEAIGNEDEENNYYSLGGDNHNGLEENEGKD